MTVRRGFVWFLLLNLLVWTLVSQLRISLPMDTQEAIVWGKYSWLGTTKHPPLSGIVAYVFYRLCGNWDGSMYLLSQLCVVLGVVYIYRLAKLFLNPTKAMLAALLQFGVIYYDFSSVEFNVNVLSLALWPMCAYYFWRAYTENHLRDWLLFGMFCALNILNKYVSALQILSFALFVLWSGNTFSLLKNYKPYAAIFLCLLVLMPHLYWLMMNNFETLNYFAARSGGGKISGPWGHAVYPLKFIGAQILFCATALLTYLSFYGKNKCAAPVSLKSIFSRQNDQQGTAAKFIFSGTIAPIAIFALISLINGHALKSMWGFPCLYMLGIFVFYFFPLQWSISKEKTFMKIMLAWSMVFACAYALQCLLTKSNRFTSDCRQIVSVLEQKWQENFAHKPLKYVGGSEWTVNMVNLYASHDVKPMVWLSPKNNPWLDREDFEQNGALLVTEDLGAYEQMRKNYPISEPQKITLEYRNYFGKTKYKDMFYGFYMPKEQIDEK